mgnify:CR=1 FL=1
MEKQKFYITTPIYYPSDKLHIGHGAIRADQAAALIKHDGIGGPGRKCAIDIAQVLPQLHGDGLRMQVIAGGDDSPVKG